jgi:hypothetical protein
VDKLSKNGGPMEGYYIANPEVVFREEEDGAIVLDPETGELKILNETGAFIFKLCDGKHTEEDIVKKLVYEFEVEDNEKVLEEHVGAFLEELHEKRLVGLNLRGG